MQPNDDDSIPDSPFPQRYETPRILTPSQRTDSYLPDLEEFPTSPSSRQTRRRHGRRHGVRHGVHRRQRRWGDMIEEAADDSRQEEERRIFKGKWSRGCRNQSCKNPFRPRPPPPPPPAASTSGLKKSVAAHGGTRKTMKNRSKKYKNKHRKC